MPKDQGITFIEYLDLVSLFNGIETFVGYLTPMLSL